MKPIIGIMLRKSYSETGRKIGLVYNDMISSVINSDGIPIGVPNDYFDNYIDICDGFILQGGDEIDETNLTVIKKIKEKNKPLLGICLGMQEMSYDNGNIKDIPNHKNTYHSIIIKENTLLHKIINTDKTIVNSRHKSAVTNTNLSVSSISEDNIIESIEDPTQKFYLGLEWHPENMYSIDTSAKKIFDYFINICHK